MDRTWFGATAIRRDLETWRRRDSVLLTGLLAVVLYFLVAVVVFANFSAPVDVGVALLAAAIGAYAFAEALFAIRPTAAHLATADRLAFLAVGTWLALGIIGAAVWAASAVLA